MAAAPEYAFRTHWRPCATAQEVFDILTDPSGLTRWWPDVYLEVTELEPADPERGLRPLIGLHTKGRLPYTLRWNFRVVESTPPTGFKLVAHGDFVDVIYDWRIKAEKPLLRYGSFVLRPFFAANHRWAMARGEESLERELARRRAEAAV